MLLHPKATSREVEEPLYFVFFRLIRLENLQTNKVFELIVEDIRMCEFNQVILKIV